MSVTMLASELMKFVMRELPNLIGEVLTEHGEDEEKAALVFDKIRDRWFEHKGIVPGANLEVDREGIDADRSAVDARLEERRAKAKKKADDKAAKADK